VILVRIENHLCVCEARRGWGGASVSRYGIKMGDEQPNAEAGGTAGGNV
jgi:hypothetical protein